MPRLIVADGARSTLGRVLGREWHRDTAYGVAARGYIKSGRSDDEWISSHLELRGEDNEVLAGYGWVFPLSDGEVNIGVGTLATAARPAQIRLRSLIEHYADARREDWQLDGPVRLPASALLPMGGAVSHVAGHNWALIGDAAGCVNPLNGEGIDYGLETGRLVAELLADERHLGSGWPAIAAPPLRRGLLDRAAARGPAHPAAAAAGRRAGGDAVARADDGRAAGDGQPGHRRGPRPHRPGLAHGGPLVAALDERPPFT